jgi:hypothetical protein
VIKEINMRKVLVFAAFFMGFGSEAKAFEFRAPPESANIEPKNYRAEILAGLRVALKDPGSVRDAAISQPALKWMGAGNRYVVCIRMNAKNSYGGYTGLTETIGIFLNGKLHGLEAPEIGQCRGVTYQPFPELEKLR